MKKKQMKVMLIAAQQALSEFARTIDAQEGDHPWKGFVNAWLEDFDLNFTQPQQEAAMRVEANDATRDALQQSIKKQLTQLLYDQPALLGIATSMRRAIRAALRETGVRLALKRDEIHEFVADLSPKVVALKQGFVENPELIVIQ